MRNCIIDEVLYVLNFYKNRFVFFLTSFLISIKKSSFFKSLNSIIYLFLKNCLKLKDYDLTCFSFLIRRNFSRRLFSFIFELLKYNSLSLFLN